MTAVHDVTAVTTVFSWIAHNLPVFPVTSFYPFPVAALLYSAYSCWALLYIAPTPM